MLTGLLEKNLSIKFVLKSGTFHLKGKLLQFSSGKFLWENILGYLLKANKSYHIDKLCYNEMRFIVEGKVPKMNNTAIEKWSSLEEIVEHLGVSKDTVSRWIADS